MLFRSKGEVYKSLNAGEYRGYTTGGKSNQTDGHEDRKVENTDRETCVGDSGRNCRTRYAAHTHGEVTSTKKMAGHYTVDNSESKTEYGTYGDNVNEHSGHWHESFQKDHVQAVTGNKIIMVEKGDYALHVQSENWDTHIAKKGRLFSENDMLIESKTKLTIKVGSSTIVLEPGKITIKSPAVEVRSGDVQFIRE